jgi:myo-inositol-1(or 4)-monophosphatase
VKSRLPHCRTAAQPPGRRDAGTPGRLCAVTDSAPSTDLAPSTAAALDLDALLDLAVDVATRAGRMLLEERPADLGVSATKSSPTDIVTEMDRAAERLVVDGLRAARPEDGFLGEEGAADAGTSGVRWVIDPIDGTVNYLYGLPAWAVSIAAEVDGAALVGVVHVPPVGETFTARRGGGAFLDGRPIRPTSGVALEQALVATGFGYEAARRRAQGRVVAQVLPLVRDVRRAGSAAIDLCGVAAGRHDAYYERGVNRWDSAAAGVVATEAGARLGGLHGAPDSPELTIAASEPLFTALHDLLAGLDVTAD